jgi:hypothetical protein
MSIENKTSARRGRPVLEGSARQARLNAQAAKVAAGGIIAKGRPSNPSSKRQAKLADKAAKIAAGITVKAGRPKATANTEAAVEEVAA